MEITSGDQQLHLRPKLHGLYGLKEIAKFFVLRVSYAHGPLVYDAIAHR
jgi:hypothetical protein